MGKIEKIERIKKIHAMLKTPGAKVTASLLAKKLGVSVETIYRDIQLMQSSQFCAVIDFDQHEKTYRYADPSYELPLPLITKTDIPALCAAQMLLSRFENTPIAHEAHTIIANLLPSLDTQNTQNTCCRHISVTPSPAADIASDIWCDVLRALNSTQILEFDYKGKNSTEPVRRTVRPYELVIDDGMCYLYGYSEDKKALRTYALTRISHITVTNRHFIRPDDIQIKNRYGGSKFDAFSSDETFEFRIEFYGSGAVYVKERIWADTQRITPLADGSGIEITFRSTQTASILSWILSQGENAKPLAPDWLVDDWQDHILGMYEMIKNKVPQ